MNTVFASFSVLLLLLLLGLGIYGIILIYVFIKSTLFNARLAKSKSFDSAEEPEDANLEVLEEEEVIEEKK